MIFYNNFIWLQTALFKWWWKEYVTKKRICGQGCGVRQICDNARSGVDLCLFVCFVKNKSVNGNNFRIITNRCSNWGIVALLNFSSISFLASFPRTKLYHYKCFLHKKKVCQFDHFVPVHCVNLENIPEAGLASEFLSFLYWQPIAGQVELAFCDVCIVFITKVAF